MFRVRDNQWFDATSGHNIKFHFMKLNSLCIRIQDNQKFNSSDEFLGLHEDDRTAITQYLKAHHVQRIPHTKANLRAFAKQQRGKRLYQ